MKSRAQQQDIIKRSGGIVTHFLLLTTSLTTMGNFILASQPRLGLIYHFKYVTSSYSHS
jgi:hypothetical protein